jgi:ribonuclease HI
MWRILHKVIPIKPNLINKGIRCDSLCPRCEAATETIEHTFLHCEWVKQLWFASPLTINTDLIQNLTFEDWIFYMLNNNYKDSFQQILAITYSIWWSRNMKVFQKVDIPVIDALSAAMKSLLDFHLHTVDASPNPSSQTALIARNNTSWNPPPNLFLKLNVDMHLHDDVRWGCGILRREDGRAVGAATKVLKGSDDSTLAEAIGISEALIWIKTLNLQKVIIETDAKILTTALEKKLFPRTNWGNVMRKVSRGLASLESVSVSWVNRKGNQVAHNLARLALEEPNKVWLQNFPTCIASYILSDMEGVNSSF